MTASQQRSAVGISAEAYEGLIIIDMDRPVMALSPAEIQVFHTHLQRAYRDAVGRERARPPRGRHVNEDAPRELVT